MYGKKIIPAILLVFLLLTACGEMGETGKIKIDEPTRVSFTGVGSVNDEEFSVSYTVEIPRLSGSADTENYTRELQKQFEEDERNFINLNQTAAGQYTYNQRYAVYVNRTLRLLSVVITTDEVKNETGSGPQQRVVTFKTNNGRRLSWKTLFARHAEKTLTEEINKRITVAFEEAEAANALSMYKDTVQLESLREVDWFFDENGLNLVFDPGVIGADNQATTMIFPVEFLRSHKLLR